MLYKLKGLQYICRKIKNMFSSIVTTHSYVRYALLAMLAFSFFNALYKDFSKKPFIKSDGIINRIALSLMHIQALIGLILYFQSRNVSFVSGFMKNAVYRYYTVEHITLMLAAVIVATIGIAKSKRKPIGKQHRTVWIFELITIALIAVSLLAMPI